MKTKSKRRVTHAGKRGKPDLFKASEAPAVPNDDTIDSEKSPGDSNPNGVVRQSLQTSENEHLHDATASSSVTSFENTLNERLNDDGDGRGTAHRRVSKRNKEKELRKQVKLMKKDCKKLQKSLGKWMLETELADASNVKLRVKDFLERDIPEEEKKETPVLAKSVPPDTTLYRWDSPHIRDFFANANNNNAVIQTDRLDIKLACPIGKGRIKNPVRASVCNHVQPFDRDTFLKLEKVSRVKKKKSFCPICNAEISSKLLVKDVFFADVLSKSGEWDDEVVVYADGSWHPRARKDVKRETEAASDEVVLGDDDDAGDVDDGDDIQVTNVKKAEAVVVDLTEDSFLEVGDDDDDDVVVL